ncbi:thiamine phosphate synthase [soil metagenome]
MDPRAGCERGRSILLRRPAVDLPRLHLVATREIVESPGFLDQARVLLLEGGSRLALHLRASDLPGRRVHELAVRLQALSSEAGSVLFVNDRVDIALACGARGVQLGGRSLPVSIVRGMAGDLIIGASVHDPAHATVAAANGADFLVAGTLWPSGSHPGRPGQGNDWLRELAVLGIPVIGIGGVSRARAGRLRREGVYGAAVVSGVWNASAPIDAVRGLLKVLDEEVSDE